MNLQRLIDSPQNCCFVCGPGNQIGLHLHFERQGGVVRASFIPDLLHGGWQGIVHGGILAAVLDEAMAYTLFFDRIKAVTARMELRFRSPASAGESLVAEAWIVRDSRRLATVDGRIRRGEVVVAEAHAQFMKLGELRPQDLLVEEDRMNQEPLDEMITRAVEGARREGKSDPEAVYQHVLDDQDLQLFLRGIQNHDRSEGLLDVYHRDIRRRVDELLA